MHLGENNTQVITIVLHTVNNLSALPRKPYLVFLSRSLRSLPKVLLLWTSMSLIRLVHVGRGCRMHHLACVAFCRMLRRGERLAMGKSPEEEGEGELDDEDSEECEKGL